MLALSNIPIDDPLFIADLVLQRTAAFLRIEGAGLTLQKWAQTGVKLDLYKFLLESNSLEQYLAETLDELETEASEVRYLLDGSSLASVVSIGPGNGFLELFLLKYGLTKRILLVDIEETTTHHHGYNECGSGYSSLAKTKKLLERNLDDSVEILTCNPSKTDLPKFEFSFLFSALSMGFHYPCDEYIEFIQENAQAGSTLMIDKRCRSKDGGFQKLLNSFEIAVAIERPKGARLFMVKDQ